MALVGREAGNRTACPDSSGAAQLGRSHAAQLAGQVGGTLSLLKELGKGIWDPGSHIPGAIRIKRHSGLRLVCLNVRGLDFQGGGGSDLCRLRSWWPLQPVVWCSWTRFGISGLKS